ncbi:short-chain fatty acyl-CoA regulator family protein [Sphingomonas sp. MMS12-HWE2-04]|uniref:helix-turn-helix domain-containing protein n=1 Tax=Sphingomonas sp. MMS12-HWE2-04 TaxID=3234199 RepID=UPI00384B2CD7
MAETSDRKLYLGPRLRVLRRELGINQSRMAEELGVSPSYLNHLERNQRPLTAQMLLRLANTYDIDVRDFVAGSTTAISNDLHEAFADPLVREIAVPRHEVMEVAENYPAVAEAVTRLYRALADLRRVPDALDGGARSVSTPLEWLRECIEERRNHFADLDAAAEAVAAELPEDPAELGIALRDRLAAHGVGVRIVSERVLGHARWHYDFHRRRLMLAERLPDPSRRFAIAWQFAMTALDAPIAALLVAAPEDARGLLRAALANYAAAALLMPYGRFHAAAEEARYDLPLLMARFGVSFEQLAHRLTTLGRSGARGVPFFLVKVDDAGIVAKRFAGEAYPFARTGGTCPRWGLHRASDMLASEAIETPDGSRFLTLYRQVPGSSDPRSLARAAVAIGCAVKHAGRIVHADGALDRVTSVGPTCHLCERIDCPDRALPPVTRGLAMDPHRRGAAPYPFRAV